MSAVIVDRFNTIHPAPTAAAATGESAASSYEGRLDSSDPEKVRQWLIDHSNRKQLAVVDAFLQELRWGRLTQSQLAHSSPQSSSATAEPSSSLPSEQQQQQQSPHHKTTTTTTTTAAHAIVDSSSLRWTTVHKTVNLIRLLIGSTAWKTAAELLCLLRGVGRELVAEVSPREPAVGNTIRRIMAAVREEAMREAYESATTTGGSAVTAESSSAAFRGRLSLETMLWALPQQGRTNTTTRFSRSSSRHVVVGPTSSGTHLRQGSLASVVEIEGDSHTPIITTNAASTQQQDYYPASYYAIRPNLKQAVLEAMQEIITELEDMHRNINDQALNHIHAGEIILTCGCSKTIELFLKAAGAKNSPHQNNPLTVLVCGTNGYEMACRLAATGRMDVTYIETAAVFAVMARVHKVLLPAYAVLANGGLVTTSSGCNLVALAAYQHSVPVVCVTGLPYKLCPLYPHENQDTLQELVSPVPDLVSDFTTLAGLDDDEVELVNPRHDYIEPKHVSLYITNIGSFQPSFIYRLLAENYHTDDWKSFQSS